jgi:signal transduction histidine kinase
MAKPGQTLVTQYTGAEEVILDCKLLKHILFNLISNALKFSPENSEVNITSDITANNITIAVKDSGIGITKEDQQHLFERFFRGHNATHIQGTGLGLNIVANYVELMGGKISFESIENKGTTFTITIPK